jgi:hypothetical protein
MADHLGGIGHVMKRRRRNNSIESPFKVDVLERTTAVVRLVGRLRVDTHDLVPTPAELRDEATLRAATDLENARRRDWKPGADPRPHRG